MNDLGFLFLSRIEKGKTEPNQMDETGTPGPWFLTHDDRLED
jgi:hypothetical protein